MNTGLTGRVALVTGASSGMGRASAVALAAEGMDVCIVGRNEDRLARTADLIADTAHRMRCVAVPADLRTKQACTSVVERCADTLGPVDVLVSVAGGADNADVLELDRDMLVDAIDIKLLATMWLAQLVAPAMQAKGWGRIITVAGSAGIDPRRDNLATSISNVSTLGLTRALSDALSADGITVNAICPGPTRTERWQRNMARRSEHSGRTEADICTEVDASIPAGRIGTPEEVAATVCFLASAPASYIHSNAIYMDGGIRRGLA